MTWTTERPDKPGIYWVAGDTPKLLNVVAIAQVGESLMAKPLIRRTELLLNIDEVMEEWPYWWGPIPQPELPSWCRS